MSTNADRLTPRGRTRRRRALEHATARAFRMPVGHYDYTVTKAVVARMRDGVELLTDVYAPMGTSSGTVLIRTPYGRTGLITLLTARYYASHGYHVVNQSCRGTFGSGGNLEPFRHEVEDGADTVAWLRSQAWFRGRFALCGASYLGYTAWAVMTDPPPELVAAVIAASAHDNYRVTHASGAFSLEGTLSLLDAFDDLGGSLVRTLPRVLTAGRRLGPAWAELPLVRALESVLGGGTMPFREWLTTTDPEADVWRRMHLGQALGRVDVPVLLHEGWQDLFVDQMTEQYDRLLRREVDVAFTIGPWTHVDVPTKAAGVLMSETLDWLAEHLAGTGCRRRPSPVRIFVTGAQQWRDLPEWPPGTQDRVLYLQPGGGLAETQPAPTAAATRFVYDPADPTPSVGGRMINPARGGRRDNRLLEARADVVTFTGLPLVDPLEVIGNPVVELVHDSDNPYADLFVRLCEVRKNDRSINLSDGFRRLQPQDANGTVRIRLDAIAHRFLPGTRIRLQVSGGAHPRFARNLGTDEDPATSTTLATSRREIRHGDGGLSRLVLPSSER